MIIGSFPKLKRNKNLESLSEELEKRREKCKDIEDKMHIEIEKTDFVEFSGGEPWTDWPDYGRYPYYYTCLECGRRWSSREAPMKVRNSVVSDKSSKR